MFVGASRQSYVAHPPHVDDGVAGHAAREVHVRVHVAQSQRPRRREHGSPAVKPGVARAGHRSPASALPIDENHVVQLVDRSKLKTKGGYPCCSSTTAANSAASRQCAARHGRCRGSFAAWRPVVPVLCCTAGRSDSAVVDWPPQTIDQPPLDRRKRRARRRISRARAWPPVGLTTVVARSLSTWSGVHSLPV